MNPGALPLVNDIGMRKQYIYINIEKLIGNVNCG